MLQAVIYYIVTVILTKELVIATDNCTEYQFKTPFSYVGESCEDIYNKNTKSHKWPGYYTIAYKVYCGMSSYTGSSCENIFKKYPEIHRINPKEKSGYYRLNNSQWTYCDMSEIAAGAADFISMCSVVEVGESRMKSTNYNYQSFLPGISCENIYNSNKGSHNSPGYYWITSRVYCGMNYTGSSCDNIYKGYQETLNKSGYYRMKENNKYQWTYCNMSSIAIANGDFISTCAGVGGGWRRIVNINISAGDDCPDEWRKATQSGVSFCRVASDNYYTCSSANFSTNGISYQRVCGRARGYQKGQTAGFVPRSRIATIDYYYVSGLSITYKSNPRQHIWTFANGFTERRHNSGNCPCASYAGDSPPPFVANNYYCEGAPLDYILSTFYFNDTLWDGAGCTGGSSCCDDATQPWFYRQLNQTTQDDIEARLCSFLRYKQGSTLIDQLELYIQ